MGQVQIRGAGGAGGSRAAAVARRGREDGGARLAPGGRLVEAELQQEMEDILGRIQGVGEVQVLLTVESDGERQLAQDSELSYSGSTAAPEDYSRSSQTVLVDDGSAEAPVVTRTVYPTYRGALVVCQGGDRADVKLAVTEAVAALTGLSADRITVAKSQ